MSLCRGVIVDLVEFNPRISVNTDPVWQSLEICTYADALLMIEGGGVQVVFIFAREMSPHLNRMLSVYTRSAGPLTPFIHVFCSEPAPRFLNQLFAFGVDETHPENQWENHCAHAMARAEQLFADSHYCFREIFDLARSIRSSRQDEIATYSAKLEGFVDYDYLAAFTYGYASAALTKFDKAMVAYKKCLDLNRYFVPASLALCECLLILGKGIEAFPILENLESADDGSLERKVLMVAACLDIERIDLAETVIKLADAIDAQHSRTREARALYLVHRGLIKDALQLIEGITEAGPLLMVKLNDAGIKLSQSGNGAGALTLYQSAHRIVRPELRYKISMNAALAAHRLGDSAQAMVFLQRCEKEYGGPFEKLEKVKAAVNQRRPEPNSQAQKPKGAA